MRNNIVHIFFEAAAKYPETRAIVHREESISYSALAKRVKQVIAYLDTEGIREGDKVLIFIPMSIELYAYVLALFAKGAVAVFVDEWASIKRLKQCCERVAIDAFIAPKWIRRMSYFIKPLRNIKIRISPSISLGLEGSIKKTSPDQSALITFTTGSTGIPKAADRTHGFLLEQYTILEKKLALQSGDVCMVTLPIVLLCNLGLGATSVIASFNGRKPNKMDTALILQEMKSHHVKTVVCSPFFILQLSKEQEAQEVSLHKIITGGAPVFPEQASQILSAFTQANLDIVYGSTEAEPISSISGKALIQHANAIEKYGLPVGKVHPKTQLGIIQITEDELILNPNQGIQDLYLKEGELGEIVVAGDHVLKRYFNSPKAFKENKIIDGDTIWHRTGDSGRLLNETLYLNGRCRQLFEWNGHQYAPFILEYLLQSHQEIAMGTFIKKDDQVLLLIELARGIKTVPPSVLAIIPDAVLKKLAKIPRDPRHNSKIDYDALIKLL